MSEKCKGKLGFYDSKQKIFYEIQSLQQYRRCLQFYYQRIEQEKHHNPCDMLNDFDGLLQELGQSPQNAASSMELYELEF